VPCWRRDLAAPSEGATRLADLNATVCRRGSKYQRDAPPATLPFGVRFALDGLGLGYPRVNPDNYVEDGEAQRGGRGVLNRTGGGAAARSEKKASECDRREHD
jgi:hypothetical protein